MLEKCADQSTHLNSAIHSFPPKYLRFFPKSAILTVTHLGEDQAGLSILDDHNLIKLQADIILGKEECQMILGSAIHLMCS